MSDVQITAPILKVCQSFQAELMKQRNKYTITLKKLEDNLLARLSAATGNFLNDTKLVENLEKTRSTALEIEEKQKLAEETEVKKTETNNFPNFLNVLRHIINKIESKIFLSNRTFLFTRCLPIAFTPTLAIRSRF